MTEVPLAARATYDVRTGIHRGFFRAGIVVILTAGAVWGAVLLWRIAAAGSFSAISIHDVNAHGHAQIFGWVGLFVMGFAYQMFGRTRGTERRERTLARLTLALMASGIAARVVGEPLHELAGMRAFALVGLSGVLEVTGLALWGFHLWRVMAGRRVVEDPGSVWIPTRPAGGNPSAAAP